MRYASCLIFSSLLFPISGCGEDLPIDVCISDAVKGFDCTTPEKKEYRLNFKKSKDMVLFTVEDLEFLVTYYKSKCEENAKIDQEGLSSGTN